ncbi:ankyrin [Wilcoxina mikolae CBS 423.85]|nr:ankyrin [Wilcoxina mikolae CBS 423.85]
MFAVDTDKPSMVHCLLQRGANVNNRREDGKTALHFAVLRSSEVVRLLLEHGADIDARDYCGKSPLYTAVHFNRTHTVRLLLESGASLGVGDMPALHLVTDMIGWNSPKDACDTIRVLLEYGEDLTAIFRGSTALQAFLGRYPNPDDDWTVEEYDELVKVLGDCDQGDGSMEQIYSTPLQALLEVVGILVRRRSYWPLDVSRIGTLYRQGYQLQHRDKIELRYLCFIGNHTTQQPSQFFSRTVLAIRNK